MEKKKIGLWKIILVIVLVVVLIFLIVTESKMAIFKSINTKVEEYEARENIYVKITINVGRQDERYFEVFKKDGIVKDVANTKTSTGEKYIMTQITYPDSPRKNLYEIGEKKTYRIATNDFIANGSQISNKIIFNIADANNEFEKIVNSIGAKITSAYVGNKECWCISTLSNTNLVYGQGTNQMDIYVEKETGLPVQRITVVNGEEYITTYEIKFDTVTDEEIAEPDISEYELIK